jgi:hypothetical protein
LEQVTPSRVASGNSSINTDIRKVHRIATTLLDPHLYPDRDLCVLYHQRWEIEMAIDENKDHQRLSGQPLRSKLPVLVLQELYAQMTAHYAVCALRLQAAETKGLDPDRISFTEGIRVLRSGLNMSPLLTQDLTDRAIKRLHADLVDRHHLLPPRRLRFNCRVVKPTRNRFRTKKPEHQQVKLPASMTFADLVKTSPKVRETTPVGQTVSV